jgi:hypothetical protein
MFRRKPKPLDAAHVDRRARRILQRAAWVV